MMLTAVQFHVIPIYFSGQCITQIYWMDPKINEENNTILSFIIEKISAYYQWSWLLVLTESFLFWLFYCSFSFLFSYGVQWYFSEENSSQKILLRPLKKTKWKHLFQINKLEALFIFLFFVFQSKIWS